MTATRWLWIGAGILVLIYAGGTCLLSSQFIFGEGHAERPIGRFITVYLAGWVGFSVGVALAVPRRPGSIYWILGVGLVARCLLLPSDLVQENDCYRYVLDGEALVHGVNPYAYSPEDIVAEAPPEFREALGQPAAQRVLDRVSYADIPTIYPPLAQLSFAAGALVAPWAWQGQRWVFLAYDMATLVALLGLLRWWDKPMGWSVLYAWNPLILKEIANAAHSDSLAGLCLVALVACLARWRETRAALWSGLAGLALAGGVLARLYPVLLFPICLAYLGRGPRRGRTVSLFVAVFAGSVFLAWLPFLGVGLAQATAGLRAYGAEWQRNDGVFSLIAWLFPQPRLVAAAVVAAIVCFVAARLYRGAATEDRLLAAMQTALLGWFLLLPAAYPWYAVGLLAISTLRPRPWVVVVSGALVMYYLLFLYEYRAYPAPWPVWTRSIEHGLVWLAVIAPQLIRLLRGGADLKEACS